VARQPEPGSADERHARAHYIDELSVTELTSNPVIFEHAVGHGNAYDEVIPRYLPIS